MVGDGPMILRTLCFGLVGALFLGLLGLGPFCLFRDRRHLRQTSEVGEGVVIGFTNSADEGYAMPRVRFACGGVTVIITGSVGSCPPAYRVGQRVPVRYPPGRPDLAIIADFRHLYLFAVSLIVFGVAVLLLVLQWFVA